MAYNEDIAHRLRESIAPFNQNFIEKRMFGGVCWLYHGKMTVGVIKDHLVARVLSPQYEEELQKDYASEMNFTGKIMKEFLYLNSDAYDTEEKLMNWINLGIEHAQFKINCNHNSSSDLIIFNLLGSIVYSKNNISTNEKINTNQLSNGVYHVRISNDGNSATKKLIIKH